MRPPPPPPQRGTEDAGERRLERLLTVVYVVALAVAVVAFAAFLVAWLHWAQILENCEESAVYCGCVLYGSETFNYFTGGPNIRCHFVAGASLPVVVLAALLAGYHGYRSCIQPARSEQPTSAIHTDASTRLRPKMRPTGGAPHRGAVAWAGGDPSCVCWPLLAALAVLVCALLFAQAVVLSDGRMRTCHEYRKHAVKVAMATGQVAEVIYERLPCDAILDMMDYLEPFSRPFRPFKDSDARHPFAEQVPRTRGGMIDTAAALDLAQACAWIDCVLFACAAVLNVMLARRRPGIICCC